MIYRSRRVRGLALLVVLAAGTAAVGQTPPPPPPPTATIQSIEGGTIAIQGPVMPGMPPRDREPAPTGTARIKGRVVAADTGNPLRRVNVRISAQEIREIRVVTTDPEGRFELSDLPAGRYSLSASKAGFVELAYGQRRPFETGRPVDLANAQTLQADFSLPRAGVITGRIVDEYGEAVADAMVQALRFRFMNGKRRAMSFGRPAQTNDLGQFRLHGLPPSEYFVSVTVHGGGTFGVMPAGESPSGYGPTYYPSAPSIAEAQKVEVDIGAEALADIQLVPTRLATISGMARDSQGKPLAGAMIFMRPKEEGAVFFMVSAGGPNRVQQDGSFTVRGVAPGNYVLTASPRAFMTSADEAEVATLDVQVSGEDVVGLSLRAQKGGTIKGRVIVEGPSTMPASQLQVMTTARDADAGPFAGMVRPGPVKDDWTFETKGANGPVVLRVMGLAPGWRVRSVTRAGDDITDEGLDVKPGQNIDNVQIHLDNRITELSGSVLGPKGETVTDCTIVVFAEDAERWKLDPMGGVRTSRPDQYGRFRVEGLRPGRYLAVAVEYVDEASVGDPELLDALRPSAAAFTIADAERRALDLKLARTP